MKIDLGAGRKREGYITVDNDREADVDVYADILDLPFDSESVDEVRAFHILEHINPMYKLDAMKEIYRVMKKGAILEIEVPQFPHPASIQDPTHVSFWCAESFWYFIKDNKFAKNFWARYKDKVLFDFIEDEDKGWAYRIKLKK